MMKPIRFLCIAILRMVIGNAECSGVPVPRSRANPVLDLPGGVTGTPGSRSKAE